MVLKELSYECTVDEGHIWPSGNIERKELFLGDTPQGDSQGAPPPGKDFPTADEDPWFSAFPGMGFVTHTAA